MLFKRPPTSIDGVVDDLIQTYVAWREECTRVESAYCRWHAAHGAERRLAFAACLAALDGEDRAAAVYRALVERTGEAATVGGTCSARQPRDHR
jgi:hypothetical protein